MSYKISNQIIEVDFGSHALFHLAVELSKYASDDGGGIWPSNERLAKAMGCTVRSVQRYMDKLRRSGVLLEIISNKKTREYRFNMTIVRALVAGIVKFVELLQGRVSVEVHDEPQLVLPGMEAGEPLCAPLVTAVSSGGDTAVTQIELNKTSPRAAREALDLMDQCLEAGGQAVDLDQAPNLRDVSEVYSWLNAGADLAKDVLPIIALRSKGKPDGEVYSWKYYRKAVLAAAARRQSVVSLDDYRPKEAQSDRQASPLAGFEARQASERAVFERNRRAAITRLIKTGNWNEAFGARPNEAELAAFGARAGVVAA